MRWIGRILGLLILLIVAVCLAMGKAKLDTTYDITPQELMLSVAPASGNVARGRHIVMAMTACMECHGTGLSGKVFLDIPPFRIIAPNLTRGNGGVGATFSDADFIRAIRHGVGPDGHALLVMPSKDYTRLSDRDLADVIAFVKSLPPVDNALPPTEIRPLGLILLGAGQLPDADAATIDHTASHPSSVVASVSASYGEYLANISGCTGCHGAGLSGGKIPGSPPDAPPAQNITPRGIGNWTQADFMRALRVGRRPDGTSINMFMPWAYYTRMSDDEIAALWHYVHSVPPRQTGTH